MGRLHDRMKRDMELRHLSRRTQDCYLLCMRNYTRYFGVSPEGLGEEEIKTYLYHLIEAKHASQSTVSQSYSALKFFYETTLKRDWISSRIPRAKRSKPLPAVLSPGEVQAIVSAVRNLKHRAILMTIYSGGLRINEAVHLKVTDIDSSRMVIRVRHGKGKRDRYTLLAQRTLEELRHYWKQSHPVDWLFPGKDRSVPLSVSSVQKVFKEALIRTGIKKAVSVHTLRHSFKASAETISEISRDERYLGAETGCIAILHTWSQSLIDHPHIHCIVTGGGLAPNGAQWIDVQKDYFAPVKVLSRLFRGKFLYHFTKAAASGDLTYSGEIAFLKDREPFRRYVTGLYRRERVVYCKKPFRNTNHVLKYLGRYTHRVAISNNRIVRVGANDVTFRVRDPAEVGTTKLMTLDTFEFIRRFLPDRFMKIRYYGLLSNRNRKIKLARCRQLFGMPEHPEDHDAPKEQCGSLRIQP